LLIQLGEELFTWHSLDHVDPSLCYASPGSTGTAESNPWDYFVRIFNQEGGEATADASSTSTRSRRTRRATTSSPRATVTRYTTSLARRAT
jgi:hypothetical protein